MPEGVAEGICKGMYKLAERGAGKGKAQAVGHVNLLASGPMVLEAQAAQETLAEQFKVSSTLYSVTSWTLLARDALAADRHNRLHPGGETRTPYLAEVLGETDGPVVMVSDYVRAVPEQIAPWLEAKPLTLGTDGFGRSDDRPELRRFFEVDAAHIALAGLTQLHRQGDYKQGDLAKAIDKLDINPDTPAPWTL
jgi:pyruvate dehydrogenase E1 component